MHVLRLSPQEIDCWTMRALGWKHIGAAGVLLPEDMRGSEADRLYPGRLWCLSGGNDWWRDPEGHSMCARCYGLPYSYHEDWALAGPIIEKHWCDIRNVAEARLGELWPRSIQAGHTAFFMSCYVQSKFGIEVPNVSGHNR